MFGNSGLETSVIGYGGWPMGVFEYGDFDDDEAIAAARTSYDNGITLFDTAAVYGWGYGENLMGKALKDIRENVVLVTKGFSHQIFTVAPPINSCGIKQSYAVIV
jgi:aryl-alcohol dehydrogenase-like predicted oxidoreductase